MPQIVKAIKFWHHAIITGTLIGQMMACTGPTKSQPGKNVSSNSNSNPNPTVTNPSPVTSNTTYSQKVPIRVGILAIDSAISVNERYTPLLDYLSRATDRPFELVPVTQESQFTEVAAGHLDFLASNPLASVQIQRLYNTKFLVTHVRPKTGTDFSGLIIVQSDSDIQTLEDLKGKQVACVAFQTAAAGCVFQIHHLLQQGIDPFQDFVSFVENKSQDNIVFSVLNNTIDAGFIRTGQLEKMVDKGFINHLTEIRILAPMADDFPLIHTTELYPEWPIAALEGTDPELVEAVQEALLTTPTDHDALKSLNVTGFVPAVDYGKVEALIQSLKLKSWDVVPQESTPET